METILFKKSSFKVVRAVNGGGMRLIEVPVEFCTFEHLKEKAISLFFPGGSNSFLELKEECHFEIQSQSGEQLEEQQNLWTYFQENCLVPSKTTLILTSKSADFKDTSSSLCAVCGNIELTSFGTCLLCENFSNADFLNSITDSNIPMISNTVTDDDDLPVAFPNQVEENPELQNASTNLIPEKSTRSLVLQVKRSMIKTDLIQHFIEKKVELTDNITYKIINFNGIEEKGVGNGVSRDVYTIFWNEIENSCLIGADERVPCIRHDLYKKEWKAIGSILVKGFVDSNYFPTIISKSFIHFCLFGEESKDYLVQAFLKYVTPDERNLLERILTGDSEALNSEDFIDIMDQYKCRSLVYIIAELARQELYQKPHLMASCWKEIFQPLMQYFPSPDSLHSLYDKLEPTPKKVISLFKADPKDDSERDAFGDLKRYVRGLHSKELRKMLQFMTGSNLITVESIEINFLKEVSNFARRVIAHTCGPCLELPVSYSNFCELREELSNILSANSWEMDIM